MGVAAYNRGSKVIRERIDRELAERRRVWRVPRGHCEVCRLPLARYGPRFDRGCTWDERKRKWVDACPTCRHSYESWGHWPT
jgi:hypothetical protein